jgi:hypothetical protein
MVGAEEDAQVYQRGGLRGDDPATPASPAHKGMEVRERA